MSLLSYSFELFIVFIVDLFPCSSNIRLSRTSDNLIKCLSGINPTLLYQNEQVVVNQKYHLLIIV
jgi:hypothetical protein